MDGKAFIEYFFKKLTGDRASEKHAVEVKMNHLHITDPEHLTEIVKDIQYSIKNQEIFQDAVYTFARGAGDCEDFARLYNVALELLNLPSWFALIYNKSEGIGHAFAISFTNQYAYVFDIQFILRFDRSTYKYDDPYMVVLETIAKYSYLISQNYFSPCWHPNETIYTELRNLLPYDDQQYYKNIPNIHVQANEIDVFPVFHSSLVPSIIPVLGSALVLKLLS